MIISVPTKKDIEEIAERFWTIVGAKPFVVEKKEIPISITIGISEFNPGTPLVLDDLVASADRALYEGKKTGRNQVITTWKHT